MDFVAVEHTPEKVLIDMGLKRKGDLYTLKAMCQTKKKSTDDDPERETRKRQLLQEIVKEKESRGKKFSRVDDKSTAGKKMSKTRRISLGLRQYSKKRNKYVSVRYSKGGGTRLIDVPLSMTKEELIKEGKVLFFQNGVCPLGAESDMIFELVNFKGEVINTLKERNGGALPFTVQRYFEFYKLSKVQLYIACRPLVDDDSDDGELMTSPFSASDREDLVDKGKQWRQSLQPASKSAHSDSAASTHFSIAASTASSPPSSAASTSSSTAASAASSGSPPAASSASTASSIAAFTVQDRDSSCWFTSRLDDERRLKAEQDKEYEESLAIDFLKRKALEDEIAETSRLEEVCHAREARVPLQHSTAQVLIVVQHPFQGRVSHFFSDEERMLAIYDWVGSLDLHPEHFSLHAQPAITISPQDKAVDFHSVVIYVETLEQPLPMSFTSPEVNFKGFGAVGDISIEAVTDEVPHQLLQDEDLR